MFEALLGVDKNSLHRAWQNIRTDFPLAMLCLLFFTLPLLRIDQLEDSFITPKIAFLVIFLLPLTSYVALTYLYRREKTCFVLPPQSLLFGAFVLLGGASGLRAASIALWLYAIGYFFVFLTLHYVILAAVRSTRSAWTLLAIGVASATLIAAWTIAEDVTRGNFLGRVVPRLPDWRGYLAAGLGNSGHIAGYIGLFYPAAVIALLARRQFSLLLLFAIAIMTGALVVTWSVGSTGALILSLLFCLAVSIRIENRSMFQWKRLWSIVAISIFWKAFYFLHHPLNPHSPSLLKEAFSSERWVEGWPTRVAIWKTTWHMITNHPLTGIGFGNFTLEYVRQIVPSVISDPHLRFYAGAYTNEAHNEYLQVWAEGGILTLLCYVAIFGVFLYRSHRLFAVCDEKKHKLLTLACTSGVLVFLFDSLMTFPLRLPTHFAALTLFLALPEAVQECSCREKLRGCLKIVLSPIGSAMLFVGMLILLIFFAGRIGRRVAAEFLFKQGRTIAEAPLRLPTGMTVSPWNAAETAFSKGIEELLKGNLESANRSFSGAKLILRNEPFALVESYWKSALAWDSRYSNASSRYGALLLWRGEYSEAQRILRQALLDLEASEVHERLGFACYFLHDRECATREWDLCRQRRPAFAQYYSDLIRLATK